jgi:hypothetical protein
MRWCTRSPRKPLLSPSYDVDRYSCLVPEHVGTAAQRLTLCEVRINCPTQVRDIHTQLRTASKGTRQRGPAGSVARLLSHSCGAQMTRCVSCLSCLLPVDAMQPKQIARLLSEPLARIQVASSIQAIKGNILCA